MDKNEQSSTEEQELAQDALTSAEDGTETTTPADESDLKEQSVPVPKFQAMRQRAQTAEIEVAKLQGRVEAMQEAQQQQGSAPKSPVDLEIERQVAEGIAAEDVTITAKVYKAQKQYEQQIAQQQTESAANNELAAIQTASVAKSKAKYADWQDVTVTALPLLTQGEVLDISKAGDNYGEFAYEKCKAAIARNAPKANSVSEEPALKPKKDESDTGKVPTQEEILKGIDADPQTIAAAQL